ncbi:MAG: type IV pilus biogenesis/stability protein PilW [Aquimonas sp.]|nr:type IV pilus biogenesis/stability protein PilW [Aquimonas sp.]
MRPERWLACLVAAAVLGGCASDPTVQRPARGPQTSEGNANAASLHVEMGRAYLQRGDLRTAQDRLQRALQLDPRSTDAHTVIAVLNEKIDRREVAERHYRRAVDLKPDDGALNNNYGQFLCRQGRFDEADRRFRAAVDDPFYETPALAFTNAGVCAFKAGRIEAAEAYLRRSLELDADQPDVLLDLARIHVGKREPLRARAFLQRYEAAAGSAPDALELGVLIEEALGDSVAADRYRNRLRQDFPEHGRQNQLQGEPVQQ